MGSPLIPALVVLCVAGGSGDRAPLAPAAPLPGLVGQVASGGFVLFFRHATRDASALSTSELAVADNAGRCTPGSELTQAGTSDAAALGAALARDGVKVHRVYASPTCRTTQMARLAFGAAFETTRALAWPGMWSDEEREPLTAQLRSLLGTPPPAGTVVVLVSHDDVLQAARVGVDVTLDPAEAAVFRPVGNGGFEFVGKIGKDQWAAPAPAAASAPPGVGTSRAGGAPPPGG